MPKKRLVTQGSMKPIRKIRWVAYFALALIALHFINVYLLPAEAALPIDLDTLGVALGATAAAAVGWLFKSEEGEA